MATNNSRQRGHSWELACIKLLKAIGWTHLVSTRSESRNRDNQKIDIMNANEDKNGRIPINVQAKNYSTRLDYPKVLGEMPQDGDQINVIFHKYTEKAGKNFMTKGTYAILELDDFIKIFDMAYNLEKK